MSGFPIFSDLHDDITKIRDAVLREDIAGAAEALMAMQARFATIVGDKTRWCVTHASECDRVDVEHCTFWFSGRLERDDACLIVDAVAAYIMPASIEEIRGR